MAFYAKIRAMKTPQPPSRMTPSYRLHRKQFIWQILVPILVALLFLIVASVLVATSGNENASLGADISVIWLVIPVLFFAFLLIALLAGLVYAMAMLLKVTPTYTYKARLLTNQGLEAIERAADATTKPILFLGGISATIKRIFKYQ